eukprot:1955551-Lingulodinium_polyedra.AAC.1
MHSARWPLATPPHRATRGAFEPLLRGSFAAVRIFNSDVLASQGIKLYAKVSNIHHANAVRSAALSSRTHGVFSIP